jgi:NitT/TauT family transport system permease protein
MLGFALSIVVGVLLGFLIGSSRLAYTALYPLMVAFNAVPKAAVVPILVVWFGIGLGPGVLTAFLISFFPITVNIATGLATLEPELEDVLRVLGAKRWDVLVKVGLPRSSMPYFYGSLKIAITLAFVGTVLAEMTAGDSGIGYLMQTAGSQQRMPLAFAGLVTIGAMAMAMYELFSWVEKRTTGWAHRGALLSQRCSWPTAHGWSGCRWKPCAPGLHRREPASRCNWHPAPKRWAGTCWRWACPRRARPSTAAPSCSTWNCPVPGWNAGCCAATTRCCWTARWAWAASACWPRCGSWPAAPGAARCAAGCRAGRDRRRPGRRHAVPTRRSSCCVRWPRGWSRRCSCCSGCARLRCAWDLAAEPPRVWRTCRSGSRDWRRPARRA